MIRYKDFVINSKDIDISIVESILDITAIKELNDSDYEVIMEMFDSTINKNQLNEGISNIIQKVKPIDSDTINKVLKKYGSHARGGSKGVLHYLLSAPGLIGKLFIAMIKGDTKEIKKIIRETEITKEDVLNFLLQLDIATMHLISGPIHTLDSITGWDIWANVNKKMKLAGADVIKKIKDSLEFVKNELVKIFPKQKELKHKSAIDQLTSELPV